MNELVNKTLELVRAEETGLMFNDLLRALYQFKVTEAILKDVLDLLMQERKVMIAGGLIFPR